MATAGRIQHCAICEKCECRLTAVYCHTGRNIAIPVGVEKPNGVATQRRKKSEDMYNHLDRILACDRQTSCHGTVRAAVLRIRLMSYSN